MVPPFYLIMRKIILNILALFVPLAISAYKDPASGVVYEINGDGTAKVASNNFGRNLSRSNIDILSSFTENGKTYTVTEISENAFGASEYGLVGGGEYYITSVSIPETVTTIGSCAFAYCYNLTSVNLPSNLSKLGVSAFYKCESLSSAIEIPASLSTIERGTFNFCKNLTSIKISEGVKVIGGNAFSNTGVTKMYIPNSVEKLEGAVFYGCENLQEVTLPNNLNIIEAALFQNSGLLKVNLPNSIKEIRQYAFYGCKNLTSIQMPENLTTIGNFVFWGCKNLTELFIPKGVESIGRWIVCGCDNLKTLTVENGNQKYDSRDNCNGIIETANNTLIVGCPGTQIPSNVEYLGEYAFSRCTGLKEIIIPGNVKSIGENAFEKCDNLLSVKIDEGVNQIGGLSFDACQNLETLILPNSITEIGYGAFGYCKLKSVTSYIKEPFDLKKGTFVTTWTSDTTYTNGVASIKTCITSYDVDATLYVPIGTKEQYQNTEGWKLFKEIVEKELTGIRSVYADFNSEAIYDLRGQRTTRHSKGINIIRKYDGSVTKVIRK